MIVSEENVSTPGEMVVPCAQIASVDVLRERLIPACHARKFV